MDEVLKVLAGSGPLGIVVIVLWRRMQDLERRLEEKEERHRKEIDAFHGRLEGKSDNFGKHLVELSMRSQENDVKTNAILEGLRDAIRASGSRKRSDG